MKKAEVLVFVVCFLVLNACRVPFTEIGCDYFAQNPEEKKKKDILDILSSRHWYLAEYYVDGVDAMDTVRKYRVGEDISFNGYPTSGHSCVRSNPLYSVTSFTKICSKFKERLVVGQDSFNLLEATNECYIQTTPFIFVASESSTFQLGFGIPFIYSIHSSDQLKNKDYIKFPYYDARCTLDKLDENNFNYHTSFYGVTYLIKFKKKI